MKSLLVKLGVVLIGLAIFTYAEVCRAEGSWVLWESTIELSLPTEWRIIAVYPKYEQCIERHKEDFEILRKNYKNMGFNTHSLSPETIVIEKVHSKTTSGDITVIQKCLPDTIDPMK